MRYLKISRYLVVQNKLSSIFMHFTPDIFVIVAKFLLVIAKCKKIKRQLVSKVLWFMRCRFWNTQSFVSGIHELSNAESFQDDLIQ